VTASRVDARGRLADEPFDDRVTKAGAVRISYGGRVVTTVSGRAAARLATALVRASSSADPAPRVQLLLAKATGNFKHGNER
jgi:hypothetical protein